MYKLSLNVGIIISGLLFLVSCEDITLHTDLVEIIGKSGTCRVHQSENSTYQRDLMSLPAITISNYNIYSQSSLDAVIGKCDTADLNVQRFTTINWTCFTTNNSTSRDTNWYLVDCNEAKLLTLQCLKHDEILIIKKNLCKIQSSADNNTCHEISYGADKSTVCSKKFQLRRHVHLIKQSKDSFTGLDDVIAYLCVAFILVTFLIAVLVPSEKCKPTYKYDKEAELRVPLEIYEMYGVNYMPSAKKRRARRSSKLMSIPTISSHGLNIAAVANNPFDWRSRIAQIQKPNFRKTSISDIFGNKLFESRSKDNVTGGYSKSFGYRSFREHLVTNLQHMTSEREGAIHERNMNEGGTNNNTNIIDQQFQIQAKEISITDDYYSSTPNATRMYSRRFSEPSVANKSTFYDCQLVGPVTSADPVYKGNSSCSGKYGSAEDKSNHPMDTGCVIYEDVHDDSPISDEGVAVDNEQCKRKTLCMEDRDTSSPYYIHAGSRSYVSGLNNGGKREDETTAHFDIISEKNEKRCDAEHLVCCEKSKQTINQPRNLISITVEIPNNVDYGSKCSKCEPDTQRTQETYVSRTQSLLRQPVDSKFARKYSLC